MIKLLRSLMLLTMVILSAIGLYSIINHFGEDYEEEVISRDLLLKEIEKVYKLVTIEGSFSEIYNYQHHYFADIWPFRKKALVRINAKVLVGYDLENMIISINEETKTIEIRFDQPPQILSVDHDIDYYNFENGLFNMITNQDLTEISARAKEFIREKAEESELIDQAEQQKQDFLDLLKLTVESAGWSLKEENGLLN